uniref:Rad60/SUMO-like domain-containing protein n=1 Tax=Rattus norvegicus TaxID=10116 RepID=A0A8I5ZYB0_RAT
MADEKPKEGVKTENNDHINLKAVGQDGSVVQFKIKRHTPLSKLMKAYCERQGLSMRQIRFEQSGDSSGSVTISPFSTSGMLSQLLSLYPVSYFALIVLTKESNNTKSSHILFDWRILMFFIYHCKTKDNFITFLYVAVTCRAICL